MSPQIQRKRNSESYLVRGADALAAVARHSEQQQHLANLEVKGGLGGIRGNILDVRDGLTHECDLSSYMLSLNIIIAMCCPSTFSRINILEDHGKRGQHLQAIIDSPNVDPNCVVHLVGGGQRLRAEVICCSLHARRSVTKSLAECHMGHDLRTLTHRNLTVDCRAIRCDNGLLAYGRGREARQLACQLRQKVACSCKHDDAPVLEVCLPTALEVLIGVVLNGTKRIPLLESSLSTAGWGALSGHRM
mmetsp:Transcript_7687/g.16703  ORF Transcript_7687/g.16703 Transcript_7687/m.16703 type:complete len:247 (+) Transcript_7687:210-950(+)